MSATPILSLHQVQLVYRALPALQDINWQLLPGEQWAVLGPNGSGKTSLARILSGQAKHYSGQFERSPALLQQGVAYVCFEQTRALIERDKKLDDSETRADASDPGTLVRNLILAGRAESPGFHDWVERLGITHILDRGLRYISTGEMRKSLLVAAILSEPALLILDSPLDGLDRATQRELRAVLDELMHSPGSQLQVLVLCRQLADLPPATSHVLVLDGGKVASCGEKSTVLANPVVDQLMNPTLPALAELPPPAPRPYTIDAGTPLLQLRGVNVSYGDLQVLKNVHWTFGRGQHCAVSGPNGCGKSTLLSLVTGDNHKAYGQDITLFGILRGSGESIWDIKQKYGQLDNQLHLNFAQGMKALEVVISGFFDSVGLYDDWGDDQRATAEQWLAALGLSEFARESFDALSFGMQRVVLLARAMVKSPAILLLDEPTLGMDGPHRKQLLQAIDHIAANSDTQVIFVSHSVGEMPACINQQLVFEPRDDGFEVVCLD
ncbi:ATP-binding cassette domain-containing protein [Halioglobus maricola]|uniref:ATP-binding cassette domain-containing protein n=1 Tax=Halioglobus maricola TaxID=2601894 RepID=A0A5P9NFF8_9GAMM|nr:ATP-binding cassette domain-containing protein [Halioglobus maricola]QFU74510.1 ATP-binding cassette domain-containing protein [Halioglobus maricola]